MLKPLCRADAELTENLRSFFVQDYPAFELLFGVEDPNDPAIPVVERLMKEHPGVPAKLVVHPGTGATNPKVSNLGGILPLARHELVLISDSNVRVPKGYLSELAETMGPTEERVGLVSSLFAGTRAQSFGGALECAQLNGFNAIGVVLADAAHNPVVVGKSMLMRKTAFERLGGLAAVANVLAEDYVIGKLFQHGGYRVRLARTVIENVVGRPTVAEFFRRHLRWSMLRMRLNPLAYLLEPLASPLAALPLAWVCIGPWAIAWSILMVLLRDVAGWSVLRGPRGAWMPLVLAPLLEVLMLAIWSATPFVKRVAWRGHSIRVGAGSLAFVRDPEVVAGK